MNERFQNGIQNHVEAPAQVFHQEAPNKLSILLEQGVFPPVSPITVGVGEMLRAIQLNDQIP